MSDVIQPGFYSFINEKGGTAIDVLPGNVIVGCPRDDSRETQKWQVEPSGQDYTIRNVSSRLYMTAIPVDGYHVMVSSTVCGWTFETDWKGGSNFTIGLASSAFILDLSNYGSPTPGQPVRVHPRRNHREPCQFWTLVPIEQKRSLASGGTHVSQLSRKAPKRDDTSIQLSVIQQWETSDGRNVQMVVKV